MEIEGTDRSKTLIKPGQTREFGRGQGFNSIDKTISRHHVSFHLPKNETRVYFHVIGKNPIWVHTAKFNEVKAFRSTEKGEMESGDMFCVSAKNPIWFTLKKTEIEVPDDGENENELKRESCLESTLAESLQSGSGPKGVEELEPESVDISGIDPIKEFEFVVMGHEFDRYPKKMIRDVKNFDWFLEKPGEDSDDDEKKVKKGGRRKRKKGEQNDDEWTGESEDDKEVITKSRNVQRRKYTTRSKDHNKLDNDTSKSKCTAGMKSRNMDEEDEDEDDDETLGGFIATDEDSEQEEEDIGREEEDEEEELVDDFDEEDDE
ncbi:unnamed protein product [Fraxinus pennsylvanica]|uniref:Uncharacterized protein n=1 Tax=Fraxinus pennsylvanica TaxID=56036 RepID=A0AAD1ZC87_9LAMI|nr:unnamed protein product [Fraxinus pennsylvanica]